MLSRKLKRFVEQDYLEVIFQARKIAQWHNFLPGKHKVLGSILSTGVRGGVMFQ